MKILGERDIQKYIFDTGFLNDDDEFDTDFFDGDNVKKDQNFVLNKCDLYAKFLDRLVRENTVKEREKILKDSQFSTDEILHSYYFWVRMYIKFYKKRENLIGTNGGLEDYASHILELMDHELEGEFDWDFLEKMENVIEENDSMDTILKILNI